MPRILNKSYQTLYVVISTGQARELLGKNLTVEKLAEMSDEEVEAYCKGPGVQLPLSPKFAVKESRTNSRRASSVYL